jgi:hypothetical protein
VKTNECAFEYTFLKVSGENLIFRATYEEFGGKEKPR